jgi:uncharacterized membrane protein YfcA
VGTVVIIVLVGLMAGMFSGLFGIGGGVVIVPALVFFLSLSQKTAQGTTLAMLMFPVVILGVYSYWKQGHVSWSTAAWLAGGFVVGGWLGSQFALALPPAVQLLGRTITDPLQKLFALLMIAVALRILLK